MKFRIDLTQEEYDELMKRFGNLGTPNTDGVNGAVKRMILAVSEFRKIYGLPEVARSRELYRDECVVVTIRGEDGEVNLARYDENGSVKMYKTILVLGPDKLSKSVEHFTFKKKR